MSDRLEKIYGNNLVGTEIKPMDLPASVIAEADIEKVYNMKKKAFKSLLVGLIMMIFGIVGCISLLLFGEENPASSSMAIMACRILLLVTLVCCVFGLFSSFKKMKVFLNYNYERLEYGIISTKFIKKEHTSNSNTVDKYFAHVVFKENQTYIRNVIIISSKDYESINEGDTVIVASYDGAEAYVIERNL